MSGMVTLIDLAFGSVAARSFDSFAVSTGIGAGLAFLVWGGQNTISHLLARKRVRTYLIERVNHHLVDTQALFEGLSAEMEVIRDRGYPEVGVKYERGEQNELRALVERSVTLLAIDDLRRVSRFIDAMGSVEALFESVYAKASDLLDAHNDDKPLNLFLIEREWARLTKLLDCLPPPPISRLSQLRDGGYPRY